MPTKPAPTATKSDDRRAAIIERLADHVLAHGLTASSLRPLAKAAATSDRMLLYYFKDKNEIVAATLECISARMVVLMGPRTASTPQSFTALRAQLAGIVLDPVFWPYMRVWLETASRAAHGDPLDRPVRMGAAPVERQVEQGMDHEARSVGLDRVVVDLPGLAQPVEQGRPVRRLAHGGEEALGAGDGLGRAGKALLGQQGGEQAVARGISDADALGRPAEAFAKTRRLRRGAAQRPDSALGIDRAGAVGEPEALRQPHGNPTRVAQAGRGPRRHGVAGEFGDQYGAYIRLNFATSPEIIEEGIKRLAS